MRKTRTPILVTGSHRSGTTWIGRTVSQHPQVRYEHEPFNVDHPNRKFGLILETWYSHYDSSSQKEEITRSFDTVLKSSGAIQKLERSKAKGVNVKAILRFFKHLLLSRRQRILVKDPLALLSAGWLYETYHFQVICMIRNPFAFVGSLKEAGWDFDFENLRKQDALMTGWLSKFADDIEYMCAQKNSCDLVDRAALLWNVLHFVIIRYRGKYPDWLFVKHEDIAANAELEFKKIFDYLNLEMNAKIQNYIKEYTSPRNPKNASSTSYEPRDSKTVLQTWRERLSEDEIARVMSSTSDIASQFYQDIAGQGKISRMAKNAARSALCIFPAVICSSIL